MKIYINSQHLGIENESLNNTIIKKNIKLKSEKEIIATLNGCSIKSLNKIANIESRDIVFYKKYDEILPIFYDDFAIETNLTLEENEFYLALITYKTKIALFVMKSEEKIKFICFISKNTENLFENKVNILFKNRIKLYKIISNDQNRVIFNLKNDFKQYVYNIYDSIKINTENFTTINYLFNNLDLETLSSEKDINIKEIVNEDLNIDIISKNDNFENFELIEQLVLTIKKLIKENRV